MKRLSNLAYTLLLLTLAANAQSNPQSRPQPKAQTTPPAPSAHRPYTMLYVFGDSYSDTGAGYVDGDGPTSVAYLAQRLGIPFTFYGAPNSKDKGLNFAVSGARTGAGAGHRYPHGELLSLGMKNQVEEFASLVKSGDLHFDAAQTLFFLAGGLNDRGTPEGYTRDNLESEIDTLYSLGARRFLVALLPTKIPAFATAGQQFNPVLAQIPGDERAKHPGIHIANSDWGLFYDEVITYPQKYGITNTTEPCAGRTLKDQDPTPCASPGTHFYYHPSHPSTATHKAVGDMLYNETIEHAN